LRRASWVGLGALAGFDGLVLGLNHLFVLGNHVSEPGWTLADTVLVIEAVIGVTAGAMGVLAVTAAGKDN